jgi:hypothetical protein
MPRELDMARSETMSDSTREGSNSHGKIQAHWGIGLMQSQKILEVVFYIFLQHQTMHAHCG